MLSEPSPDEEDGRMTVKVLIPPPLPPSQIKGTTGASEDGLKICMY